MGNTFMASLEVSFFSARYTNHLVWTGVSIVPLTLGSHQQNGIILRKGVFCFFPDRYNVTFFGSYCAKKTFFLKEKKKQRHPAATHWSFLYADQTGCFDKRLPSRKAMAQPESALIYSVCPKPARLPVSTRTFNICVICRFAQYADTVAQAGAKKQMSMSLTFTKKLQLCACGRQGYVFKGELARAKLAIRQSLKESKRPSDF